MAKAAKAGCTYSRYADDLTFSTNKAQFPTTIAEQHPTDPNQWTASKSLTKTIIRNGFAINVSKTRMQYHDSRQEVTGLVVNRRVNVRREYRYFVRALVHNLFRKGAIEVRDHNGTLQPATLQQLHGMLCFIDSIDLQNRFVAFTNGADRNSLGKPAIDLTVTEFGLRTSKAIGGLSCGERLFRRFLIYKDFYATTKPVVVCEGDTDNVYLLHAIHSLAAQFPSLIDQPTPAVYQLKIRLYKFFETRTGRILGLGDGGGSVLRTLIENYKTVAERFLVPPSRHPFIVLVDNDAGSAGVKGILKKYGLAFPPNGGYVHVGGNLYVMRTPALPNLPDTCIEDFFDAATKVIVVAGKTFHPAKDFDPQSHFGKTVFAHRVVRPNASTINFAGFDPILKTIVDIQTQHTATSTASITSALLVP